MSGAAKYRLIAKQVALQIEQGQITVNVKMPSLRSFCQLHGISMTTALACYRYLEKQGYLFAEYKKGYYPQIPLIGATKQTFPQFESSVCHHAIRPEQATLPLQSYLLATAQLDTELIDLKRLNRCLKAATKKVGFNLLYDEFNGSTYLRKQLSKHFNQQGFGINADELVITHGCLDAVLVALETVSKPGDVIAVSSPCYSGLLDILAILDRAVIEIPSTEQGIELNQLEHALKKKKVKACLITANFQNPTGHCLSNQHKQALAELAAQYQVAIIEDDVFRELSHQNTIPLPIKYFDTQGWVMWCASVSKTLAPGLRIGWCAPGRFKEPFINQRMVRTLGLNQPIQLALAEYIAKGYYASHIKTVNRALRVNFSQYIEFLQQHLPAQVEVSQPNGGLVLWLRLPNIDTKMLAKKLTKQGVYIKSGHLFSTTEMYHDCLRLNLGNIPNEQIYAQLLLLCEIAYIAPYG